MIDARAEEAVSFWREAGPARWFARDEAFDQQIQRRFLALHEAAARCELMDWAGEAEGALALLLLLDQFPRNLFRGSAHAFATDPLALSVAKRAISVGHDRATDPLMRTFFYLPFMHSETPADQALCVSFYEALGDANSLKFAIIHRDIIAKFGRFPHRNPVLGRSTSPDEQAFLEAGGFAG